MKKKRSSYNPQFKAKVALAAIRQEKTLSQQASLFKVHQVAIAKWKARFLEQFADVFVDDRTKKRTMIPPSTSFFKKIGRLEIENDWLKKNLKSSTDLTGAPKKKRGAIDANHPILSRARQYHLIDFRGQCTATNLSL